MSKLLYLEGASGISGDMTVAALLDLGGSRKKLDAVLNSLRLEGFDYTVSRRKSCGVEGCDFDVHLHEHHHEAEHHHTHRNLADVCAVIDRGDMSRRARDLAKKIFRIVAEAEARAHGLTEGTGFVRCQHGELPVPVPAVLNIAQAYSIPLRTTAIAGEMVTPTGIAIAAALRTRSALPGEYLVSKVGIGLGKRDFGRANLLRAMLIEEKSDPEQIYVVECNIDDSTGEAFGYAMEKLLENGAKDVHFLPCFMKKNRPAYLLRAIVTETLLPKIETIIFETTTTIGLRKFPVERTCMQRETVNLTLPFGTVRAKKCVWNDVERCYPEYESIKQLSESSGIDFHTVFTQAKRIAEEWNVKV